MQLVEEVRDELLRITNFEPTSSPIRRPENGVYPSTGSFLVVAHDAGDTITAVATITAIDDKRRRVTLKTQCLKGDTVVIDGEAVVLVPRRDAA